MCIRDRFSDVKIGKGATVEYSILMPGAVVEEGATVRYSIVAEKAVIAKGAEVGGSPSDSDADNWGVAVVAEGVRDVYKRQERYTEGIRQTAYRSQRCKL